MAMLRRPNALCRMRYDEVRMMEYECDFADCPTCGHNELEYEKRKEQIRKHGLTLCEDGKYRLIIRRK